LFPTVLTQSAFNRRLRRLWGTFILIQDAVAEQLAQGDYDVMDGFPIPYNLGMMINRLWGRPDFAFATLIV
jgi:hypothetical protein